VRRFVKKVLPLSSRPSATAGGRKRSPRGGPARRRTRLRTGRVFNQPKCPAVGEPKVVPEAAPATSRTAIDPVAGRARKVVKKGVREGVLAVLVRDTNRCVRRGVRRVMADGMPYQEVHRR
jgi:hypothetical protein